jgi:RNA 2',3'-cyclic 3'-phosphodiesterase
VGDKKMRLFVAFDIPDTIRDLITATVRDFQSAIEGARWVKPENLHLTLKFIGYYEREKLEILESRIRDIAGKGEAFTVCFGKPGAFPSPRRARVLWIGISQGSMTAGRLAEKLNARLEKVGVKKEDRAFAGHLTLARLKQPRDCSSYLEDIGNQLTELEDMAFDVTEVVLYESILSSKGPTYEALERIKLEGK